MPSIAPSKSDFRGSPDVAGHQEIADDGVFRHTYVHKKDLNRMQNKLARDLTNVIEADPTKDGGKDRRALQDDIHEYTNTRVAHN